MSDLTVVQCRAFLDRNEAYSSSTGNVGSDLFLDWMNAIEAQAYKLLVYANPEKFMTELTLSSGTIDHTVSDLMTIDPKGCGVFETDEDGDINTTKLRYTARGSSMTGINVRNKILSFTPDEIDTENYILRYIPDRTVLTAGSDTIFSEEFSDFVRRAILRQYYLWDKEGDVNMQDALFQQLLREMVANYNTSSSAGFRVSPGLY